MFESFNSINEAFSAAPQNGDWPRSNRPLRRKKTIGQVIAFHGLNAIVLPLLVLSYTTVGAEGVRQTMGVEASLVDPRSLYAKLTTRNKKRKKVS